MIGSRKQSRKYARCSACGEIAGLRSARRKIPHARRTRRASFARMIRLRAKDHLDTERIANRSYLLLSFYFLGVSRLNCLLQSIGGLSFSMPLSIYSTLCYFSFVTHSFFLRLSLPRQMAFVLSLSLS